jgi:hypothetical protein
MKPHIAALVVIAASQSIQAQAPRTPAAYWTMDQIVDGTLGDQAGLHTARIPDLVGKKDARSREILPNFAPSTAPGVKGNALALDRSQQGFLSVAVAERLSFSSGMTVSSWVKIKEASAQMVLLSCAEDVPAPQGGWCLTYSYRKVFLKAVDAFGTVTTVASPDNSVPAGFWVHVAAVAEATTLRVYLNGVQVASRPFAGPIRMADTALVIGNHATIAGWRHAECPAFGGLMDEVKIFEAPLNPAVIMAESEQALAAP